MSLDGEVWERGRVRAGSAQHSSGLLHRETEIRELNGRARRAGAGDRGAEREREAVERAGARRSLEERQAAAATVERRRDALERPVARARGGRARASLGGAGGGGAQSEIATHRGRGSIRWRARWPRPRPSSRQFQARARARPGAQLADLDGVVHALEARARGGGSPARRMRASAARGCRGRGRVGGAAGRAPSRRAASSRPVSRRAPQDERSSRARVAEIDAEVAGLAAGLTGLLETESTQRDRVGRAAAALPGAQGRDRCRLEEAARGRSASSRPSCASCSTRSSSSACSARAELDRTFERLRTEYQMDPESVDARADRRRGFDPRQAARELGESRARLQLARRGQPARARGVHEEEGALPVPGPAARAISPAPGPSCSRRSRRSTSPRASCSSRPSRKVQEHFRDVFKTLFEGGDAELRTVGEDPLECEIEIAAKPRGKHLQSISLMSGGERALTGDRAAVRDLPGQAVAVLPARRGRRAARRRQRRPLPQHAPALQRQDPVRRDHAQQEDDGGRRLPLRRDHAGARRLDAGVGEASTSATRATPAARRRASWPTARGLEPAVPAGVMSSGTASGPDWDAPASALTQHLGADARPARAGSIRRRARSSRRRCSRADVGPGDHRAR